MLINEQAKKWGSKLASGRIIGGLDFEQTIKVVRTLNATGLSATVDHLGEYVRSRQVADLRAVECMNTIRRIRLEQLDAQVSLKLTSLGLDIHPDVARYNLERILQAAQESDVIVTIDMEDAQRCQATLDLFRTLKATYDQVSTVLQAYLYRTEKDIEDLSGLNSNLRLVKGAYKETAEVAYPSKRDVDDNYKRIIAKHLLNGNYTAIATHDDAIIEYTKQITREHRISTDRFEFQMLYGMRTKKQQALVDEGYRMRVYVPYGSDWFGYFMRRLAERPANIAFVFKGFLKK